MANKQIKNDSQKNKVKVFGLLADQSRLRVLGILKKNQKKELCVTDIAKQASLSVSATSHQLRKLELWNLVARCRYGQEICYCLNKKNNLTKKIFKLLAIDIN